MKNRERGGMSFPVMVLCIVLVLFGTVGYKEFGKWKKKADDQKAVVVALEAAKAKTISDVAKYESEKAAYKAAFVALRPAMNEFNDALEVAKVSGRIALATPVLSMQKAYESFRIYRLRSVCLKGKNQWKSGWKA